MIDPLEPLHGIWIVAVLAVFGLAPGLALARRARLPASLVPAIVLAATCLAGYVVFLGYVVQPYAGRQAARVLWLLALGAFVWQCVGWRRGESRERGGNGVAADARGAAGSEVTTPWLAARGESPIALLRRRDVWLPVLLASILAGAYLMTLYARDAPINRRFTWALPSDNILPELFALRLTQGITRADAPVFLSDDWQSSDRPPLQAGAIVAFLPLRLRGRDHAMQIQVAGMMCQMGWVLALWALARIVSLTRRQTCYVLLACAGSGFFLINSLYVWPKLLAGWLCLTAAAIVLHACRQGRAGSPLVAPLIGGLAALSMLAHSGAALSVAALPVLLLPRAHRRVFTRRDLLLALATGALLLAPWIAYQRYVDPPGNRLLKHHLAGVQARDARGLVETLRDAYGRLTPRELFAARVSNAAVQVRWDLKAPDETRADYLRRQQFHHHALALDALCVGLAALWLRRPRTPAARQLRLLSGFAIASIGIWILIMYPAGAAVVHHGSYAATTVLFFCGAASVAELERPWRQVCLAVHLSLFAWIWLIARQTSSSMELLFWRPGHAVLALALFGLFGLSLHRLLPADDAPILLS